MLEALRAVSVSLLLVLVPPLPTCTCAVPELPAPMTKEDSPVAVPAPPKVAPRLTVKTPEPSAEPMLPLLMKSEPLATVVLPAKLVPVEPEVKLKPAGTVQGQGLGRGAR